MMNKFLSDYEPITLEEMSGIKLMNRIDTKFVTTQDRLMHLLDMARNDYYAQEIAGSRLSRYDTTYFDTDDFAMYRVHQSGHTGRQKLRFRTYVSSNLQFMEVKTKNNHGRTKKKRIKVEDMDLADAEKRAFLAEHLRYSVDSMQPAIRNNFDRITLVNRAKTERLTIDTNLRFFNLVSGKTLEMNPLVIIELKRDGNVYSPVLDIIRQLRIKPSGFSKYCIGSIMTNHDLKQNLFKQKLVKLRKIANS